MNEVIVEVVNEIAEFNQFDVDLVEFKKKYEGIVYDFSDPAQALAAKDNHKEIRKAYNKLEGIRKDKKKEYKVKVDLIDGEGKRIKDQFDILCEDIKGQQEAHEKKAILQAAVLHKKVTDIEDIAVLDDGVVYNLDDLLKSLQSTVVDSTFEEREADGHMAKAKAIEIIEGKIALAEKRKKEEEEAKIALAKAQQEREEELVKEAIAQANKEKEEAAIAAKEEAKAAKKKAEQEKTEAVKAEKEKSIRIAQEKEMAARIEVERLQSLEDEKNKKIKAKQENQAHRAKVHKDAKESLMALDKNIDEGTAISIVKAIASGQIKSVLINY